MNKDAIDVYKKLMHNSSKPEDFEKFVQEYLTPEKRKEFGFNDIDILKLITATGKVEEYLTPASVKKFNWDSWIIQELILKTGKIEEYLIPEKIKEFELDSGDIAYLILETGKTEEYLTPEKIKEFGLDSDDVKELLQDFDSEWMMKNLEKIYLIKTGKKLTSELYNKIQHLCNKNKQIVEIIKDDGLEFLSREEIHKDFTEEQILRIMNYPEIQSFMVKYCDNKLMAKAISYLMEHDTNWVISLDKMEVNKSKYKKLLSNISKNNETEVTEEVMQQLLSILSDTENYFEVQDIDDVNNFYQKRNEICLKILNGNTDDIPDTLKSFNKDDLCKFALLEYKMGISLDEAQRLIKRYGKDSRELPSENIVSKYLNLLKDMVECEDIQSIVDKAIAEDALKKPWLGFPNARNAEGDIINLFAELYNDVLYNPKNHDEDKSDIEEYVEIVKDDEGNTVEKKHKIDVYTISKDFNMNIRVEKAYRGFNEPENFKDYYDRLDFSNHGNCESFIGNDNIAVARNTDGVMVGYSYIRPNSLAGMGPYDLYSENIDFSIFNENNEGESSEYRIPRRMIDNTRHNHNEMIKERVVLDENGNITKNTPDFAVWIEETPRQDRNPIWQEEKEKNPQWIMTKKLAAQLGIPIVVIDREYFAEREMEKIQEMINSILGKETDEQNYKELSKPELIEEVITKFENNVTGLRFNEELNKKFFTRGQLIDFIEQIKSAIKEMPQEEAKQCMQSLINVTSKEYLLAEEDSGVEKFYLDLSSQLKDEFGNIETTKERTDNSRELLQLYFNNEVGTQEVNQEKQKLEKDLEGSKSERIETVSKERK